MKLLLFLVIPVFLSGQTDTLRNADKNYKACFFIDENPSLFLSKKINGNFDVRMLLDFEFSHLAKEIEEIRKSINSDTTTVRKQINSGKTTTSNNYISLMLIYNFSDNNPFDFYFGLGPRFGINFLDVSIGKGEEYLYGMMGIAGIEYQVNENIFFLSEYRFSYYYITSKLKDVRNYNSLNHSKDIYIRKYETWGTYLSKLNIGIGIKF